MGADTFYSRSSGKTANEAFSAARENAAYESGHGGYSGTIYEKHDFRSVSVPNVQGLPTEQQAAEYANKLLGDEDHWVQDKWGPAACIEYAPKNPVKGLRCFIFFGWASS